jgi:hypothetical protein
VDNLFGQLQGDWAWASSLGGGKVIGMSYVDTSLAKSNGFVPLVRVHYLALTNAQVCIADVVDIVNKDANPVVTQVVNGCVSVSNIVTVNTKMFLEGPFDGASLMHDHLRSQSLLPTSEPYGSIGFVHVSGGGGELAGPLVFDVTGNNAIVDWVFMELRSAATPSLVLATRSALLQRDGDVVGMDGTSPVLFNASAGNYHVAVRHRNHLGAMTALPVTLAAAPILVDLSSPSTVAWGTDARKNVNGVMTLYAGNVRKDVPVNGLRYTGANNDRDPILSVIGGVTPTSTVSGYLREDVNLSGTVKYTGSANDRDPILVNIGGVVPTNIRPEQLP